MCRSVFIFNMFIWVSAGFLVFEKTEKKKRTHQSFLNVTLIYLRIFASLARWEFEKSYCRHAFHSDFFSIHINYVHALK